MRFVLPPKADDGDFIYAPYLRCKGSAYSCHDNQVSFRLVDFTILGTPINKIPESLGVRPQAMKMKFATPNPNAIFLKNFIQTNAAVEQVAKRTGTSLNNQILHRAFIGETISLIYLPLVSKDDHLFDAVTDDPLTEFINPASELEQLTSHNYDWKPGTIPNICPECGWDLSGNRDSVVMSCKNCESFWEARGKSFRRVAFSTYACRDNNAIFLPFWKIQVREDTLPINSLADFIRVTNQPIAVRDGWAGMPMNIWVPAFKITPKIFLRLGSRLTIGQRLLIPEEKYPELPIQPINLHRKEAIQSLKIILASAAANKRDIISKLSQISFSVEGIELALIPFTDNAYSLYNEETKLNVNKQTLKYGRFL